MNLVDTYADLMRTARMRLDFASRIRESGDTNFISYETGAFHLRKVVEAIAFGCLVATDHGLNSVPREARGQWSADKILSTLKRKGILTLPSPSSIRVATEQERETDGVAAVIEGIPDHRLSNDEIIAAYRRVHVWLHEINPYVRSDRSTFIEDHGPELWHDLVRIDEFLSTHTISIRGAAFVCVLRDSTDGTTKVFAARKASSRPS